MVTGKELIELGYKPSKIFKDALIHINDNNLTTVQIIALMEFLTPPEKVALVYSDKDFYRNIEFTNSDEESNYNSVVTEMRKIMRLPTVLGGAIMPDACPVGVEQIPVGGVVVTENTIHPSFHSADICCSVMTTNLGKVNPKDVLDISFGTTQFGAGGRKGHNGWNSIFYDNKDLVKRVEDNFFTKDFIVKAASHIGTQGDGNHFLFVGVSEKTGDTYLVTHHGSRGFGASVYKKGMFVAKKLTGKDEKNPWISYDEIEGKLYWEALQIIRDWTKLNHESIHDKIVNKLKIQYLDRYWNEHNFVFKDGNKFYHAKGATPLSNKFVPDSTNGLRLIPLNMSQPILVVKGETTENNLGFAPHGAGRNFSRSEHKRRNTKKTIDEIFKIETKGLDIRFFSGNIDISELPSAYKNAKNVEAQMSKFNLGEVVDRILPYGCIMAGDCEIDAPWKNRKKK